MLSHSRKHQPTSRLRLQQRIKLFWVLTRTPFDHILIKLGIPKHLQISLITRKYIHHQYDNFCTPKSGFCHLLKTKESTKGIIFKNGFIKRNFQKPSIQNKRMTTAGLSSYSFLFLSIEYSISNKSMHHLYQQLCPPSSSFAHQLKIPEEENTVGTTTF